MPTFQLQLDQWGGGPHPFMMNVGKKAAGGLPDGREWNEPPLLS
jgi:hypothetical protein